jgi:hypothetical protein
MGIPEFVTVAGITMICYLIGYAVKASALNDKWIPLIVGCCGGALGVVGMMTMPEFPVNNVIDAVAVGIASGLAATGAHQIGKQLTKD